MSGDDVHVISGHKSSPVKNRLQPYQCAFHTAANGMITAGQPKDVQSDAEQTEQQRRHRSNTNGTGALTSQAALLPA